MTDLLESGARDLWIFTTWRGQTVARTWGQCFQHMPGLHAFEVPWDRSIRFWINLGVVDLHKNDGWNTGTSTLFIRCLYWNFSWSSSRKKKNTTLLTSFGICTAVTTHRCDIVTSTGSRCFCGKMGALSCGAKLRKFATLGNLCWSCQRSHSLMASLAYHLLVVLTVVLLCPKCADPITG